MSCHEADVAMQRLAATLNNNAPLLPFFLHVAASISGAPLFPKCIHNNIVVHFVCVRVFCQQHRRCHMILPHEVFSLITYSLIAYLLTYSFTADCRLCRASLEQIVWFYPFIERGYPAAVPLLSLIKYWRELRICTSNIDLILFFSYSVILTLKYERA